MRVGGLPAMMLTREASFLSSLDRGWLELELGDVDLVDLESCPTLMGTCSSLVTVIHSGVFFQ